MIAATEGRRDEWYMILTCGLLWSSSMMGTVELGEESNPSPLRTGIPWLSYREAQALHTTPPDFGRPLVCRKYAYGRVRPSVQQDHEGDSMI